MLKIVGKYNLKLVYNINHNERGERHEKWQLSLRSGSLTRYNIRDPITSAPFLILPIFEIKLSDAVICAFMLPGEYEFGTADKEFMEILAGQLEVLLPGSVKWLTFNNNGSFEVPANSKFKLKVTELTDYCCSYIKTA